MYEWYVPITILPGIGLLVTSTSNLLVNLSDEISMLLRSKNNETILSRKKLRQLNLLNLAMVGFYFGSAAFVLSGILMILSKTYSWCYNTSLVFIVSGILAVLVSLCLLVLFSFRAVTIRKKQFQSKIEKYNNW
ncbi:MAG: hypothetical protein GQ525_14015 [Draconibacterium sp.]|nr:hypothetical protein [Draconibacterium sp.]